MKIVQSFARKRNNLLPVSSGIGALRRRRSTQDKAEQQESKNNNLRCNIASLIADNNGAGTMQHA